MLKKMIGRVKKFRILNSIIPITQVDLIEETMVTICDIVKLNTSVVTSWLCNSQHPSDNFKILNSNKCFRLVGLMDVDLIYVYTYNDIIYI